MYEVKTRLKNIKISTTSDYGIDANYLEAAAFAYLAKHTLSKKAGNIPSVTGANQAEILGGIYLV
jgi:anhydro-N-acetylmuramic acid kinase